VSLIPSLSALSDRDQLVGGDCASQPILTVKTDLTHKGLFGEETIVITTDHLIVYDQPDGVQHVRIAIALGEMRAPRLDTLVGGGTLQAEIAGEVVDLAWFTNAKQAAFGRVVAYLEDLTRYQAARLAGQAEAVAPAPVEETEEERRCPNCNLLLPQGATVCPACINKRQIIARLAAYLKPYWKQTALLAILILSSTTLGLVAPYLTRPLADQVLVPISPSLSLEQRYTWLGGIVLTMMLAQILSQAINIVQGRTAAWLTHQLAHDLRAQLYRHLQALSLRYFDKRQTGALMARITHDTRELESILTMGAQFFLANLLSLVGISIVLCLIDWRLFLLALAPAPVVTVVSRLFWRRIANVWGRWWHARSRLSAVLNDTLSGVRVVKAFAQEQREIERFNPRSRELSLAGMNAEQTWMTIFPLLTFLTGTGSLLVWYLGGQLVLNEQITLGTLLTFIAYLAMFYGPLQFVNRMAEVLGQALASAERVFNILDTAPDVDEATHPVALPQIKGRVEFSQVTFGYDAHKPVLSQVGFQVEPGEMIGIVGPSGAGKSTTINLLCRLYDVNQGKILIDGVDIRAIRQRDLRSQIGIVLQDTFLFNGTIAENIAYAKADASLEEIMAAATAANAHDFILKKPDGYDTIVGERGQQLSGGERQRIAIARAILHNPRILILDEATSSVDTDTEKQIQEAIARLIKGRTTFAIAHRLSTLRNADRLLVFKDGRIVETGTHDALLEQRGEFYRLVEIQRETSRITEGRFSV
jgi:ATP-binding cassette, subfamily B, bacterial